MSTIRPAVPTRARTAMGRSRRTGALRGHPGAVTLEYVTLLMLVTLGLAIAVAGLGVPLLRLFRFTQSTIVIPIP